MLRKKCTIVLMDDDAQNSSPELTMQKSTSKKPSVIEWTASEFLHHQKNPQWLSIAIIVLLVSTGLIYLITDDLISTISVLILGTLLVVVSLRKPRVLHYRLSDEGLTIGNRDYIYNDFLSFAIIREDMTESIMLIPQKRWSPAMFLYFAPEDGQKIFELIGTYLPFEEKEKDAIDKFLHKIRF